MSSDLEIYIDGACSGNPGEAAIGVRIEKDKKVVREISESIGNATNNIAEYSAMIKALEEASALKAETIKIFTDSELLYYQVTGKYKVRNDQLKLLFVQTQKLGKGFKKIEIERIGREKNSLADKLATSALKRKQVKMVAPLFQASGEESPSSGG